MNRLTVAYTGALLMLALGCKDLNLGPKDQVSDASFWKSPASSSWPPMISTSRCAALTRGGCTRYLRRAQFRYRHRQRELGDVIDEQRVVSAQAIPTSGTMHMPESGRPTICSRKPRNRDWDRKSIAGSARRCSSGRITTGPGKEVRRCAAHHHGARRQLAGGVLTASHATRDHRFHHRRPRRRGAELVKRSQLAPKEMGRVTQGAALALKARAALYQGTCSGITTRAHPRR